MNLLPTSDERLPTVQTLHATSLPTSVERGNFASLMTNLAKILILGCCLLSLVGCQSSKTPVGITAQVQRVVSGQTLEVIIHSKQPALIERVRLIGISAPDLQQQPWGVAAKNKLEELVAQSNAQQLVLQLETEEKDRFDRLWAYVWQDETLINELLVAQGYALATLPIDDKYYQRLIRAQEYARLMGYGIWNPNQPMRLTPEEFRSKT